MVEAQTSNTSVDYCRNLQCVLNISFGDIEAFSSRGPAKRDHDRGYNYFAEKYLFIVRDFQALSKRLKSPKTRMTQAMKDGIANEPLAAEAYSNRKGNTVNLYPAGIVIHPDTLWLAASPDRKVYDQSRPQDPFGLLEIKSPSMSTRGSLEELPYLENINGKLQLKRNDHYYYQIQMQLAVTGLEWCDFFVWSIDACHLETIHFDANFWNGNTSYRTVGTSVP